MDLLGEDLLSSVVGFVQTNTHARVSKAFLQAQLQRRGGRLTISAEHGTKLLPGFLWSGSGGTRQLHLQLLDSGVYGFRLRANLDASACVVRRLSASAEFWIGLKLHENMPGLSSLCLTDVRTEISTIVCLKGLTHLELKLCWEEDPPDAASIGAMLAGMTRLRSMDLDLPKTGKVELLSYVGRMTWLEKLDVAFLANASANLDHVPSMLALLTPMHGLGLSISSSETGREEGGPFGGSDHRAFTDIAHSLAGLTGLVRLEISVSTCRTRNEPDVFRTLGASLAKLEDLIKLDVNIDFSGRDVTEMLGGLLRLRRLRSLHLSDAYDWSWGDPDMGFSAPCMASLAPVLEGLTDLRFGFMMDGMSRWCKPFQ